MNELLNSTRETAPWKLLIVDDDPDVHVATRMALRGVTFRGRRLSFIDAYSGTQALEVLQDNPDTAIAFLDVIMETDDAGLRAALRIRESGFKLVRIIVRTGFPGQAPEREVIVDYDIHDYKEKAGLSVQQLFSSVVSALRAYDDLVALDEHRRGLMGVLDVASSFDFNAVQRYASRMLAEFTGLARLGSDNIVVVSRPVEESTEEPKVLASFGCWQDADEPGCLADLPPEVSALVVDTLTQRQALCVTAGKTLFAHNHAIDLVVFATGVDAFAQSDEVLLEMFLMNVCQTIRNQRTYAEMLRDRDVVLHSLALRGNRWLEDADVEMDRLAALATALATRLHTTLSFGNDIDSSFIQCIGIASVLHDIGNEAVPISLLAKQSVYQPSEHKQMETHVSAGVALVDGYWAGIKDSGVLGLARDVIGGHHEFFDGSGYPQGKRGDAIPLAARVVAVADVYIALTSVRPHRPAFDCASAQAMIRNAAGKQFDPCVVDAFVDVVIDGIGN